MPTSGQILQIKQKPAVNPTSRMASDLHCVLHDFARWQVKIWPGVLHKEAFMLAPTLKGEMEDFAAAVKRNRVLFRGEQFIQEVWWEIFAEDMLRQMAAKTRKIN
jgi:hypothetical protein